MKNDFKSFHMEKFPVLAKRNRRNVSNWRLQ